MLIVAENTISADHKKDTGKYNSRSSFAQTLAQKEGSAIRNYNNCNWSSGMMNIWGMLSVDDETAGFSVTLDETWHVLLLREGEVLARFDPADYTLPELHLEIEGSLRKVRGDPCTVVGTVRAAETPLNPSISRLPDLELWYALAPVQNDPDFPTHVEQRLMLFKKHSVLKYSRCDRCDNSL